MKTIALLNKKKEIRRICDVDDKNAERLVASKLAVYYDSENKISKAENFLDMRVGSIGGSKKSKYNKDSE